MVNWHDDAVVFVGGSGGNDDDEAHTVYLMCAYLVSTQPRLYLVLPLSDFVLG